MWTCWDVFRSPDRKLACPLEGKLACYLMGSLHAKGPKQKCADEQSVPGVWCAGRPSPWSPTDERQLARSEALERVDSLGSASASCATGAVLRRHGSALPYASCGQESVPHGTSTGMGRSAVAL